MKVSLKSALIGSVSSIALATAAHAENFNIPGGDLETALNAYASQTGVALILSDTAVRGARTRGVRGDLTADVALSHILEGTGFTTHRTPSGAIGVVHEAPKKDQRSDAAPAEQMRVAAASASAGVETVVVTSSKIKGDIQTVPIAITALSQEQLTARQIAGGPDLVKEVPNLTFSKTNFTGYNIEIRGIGTQAISVTTDPAVAVAFNDTPFIRNHFFEQEFYDVSQVEVLRGPQGTLYGRNATAGVVNVVSAKPTDQFEAMLSADIGNYTNRRYEGMVNLPIVDDRLDLRVAGEWTKRDGYTFNQTTGQPIDGRDLWSGRVTLGWKPVSSVQTYLVWEHFQEDDDRLRTSKQLCKTDQGPSALTAADGTIVQVPPAQGTDYSYNSSYFSQGCLPASLYSKDSFQVPNGFALPFVAGAAQLGFINKNINPYAEVVQSTNLRNIQSAIEPKYLAKNDTLEFNASWNISPTLTFYSDTGYNRDFLWSSEDYNRFDTSPGIFLYPSPHSNVTMTSDPAHPGAGIFCDPQLGCSDRLVVQDLSSEHAWQLSQEVRLASNFQGPFNFSVGGNYLHYETDEDYYVFSNTFTMISLTNVICSSRPYVPGVTDNLFCLQNGRSYDTSFLNPHLDPSIPTETPQYIDPNPITSLDGNGHNYFVSKNPYVLNSYAGFGEAYYNVTDDLKLTGGLRWTDDQKHFIEIPSELFTLGYGYPTIGTTDQSWQEWTGRFVANWSPKLSFTDQSMFYASYSHGYKAGGANPPGAVLIDTAFAPPSGATVHINFPVHPLTFKPEFIDAYEAGSKNTLLDGALTLNGDVFFYNYKGYQISQIVDRTSVNLNFDATVKGAELEATWEPLAGLKFSFAGGYEDTNIDNNQYAIDLMDRTAGVPGWIIARPNLGQASNCILPIYVAAAILQKQAQNGGNSGGVQSCGDAYTGGLDPVTRFPYVLNPTVAAGGDVPPGYPGFDPLSVDPNAPAGVNNGQGLPPNNGEGFVKNVGGNELPNAPHYTISLSGDYTMPVSANWAATLHSDFYWQSQSMARVFNDRPYDKIRGYSTSNLALILTDASGWQVMGYVKNVFDVTAITGDFLNSDDSGLTTNVFLTDPRLYGIRVTKNFDAGSSDSGGFDLFSNADGKRPQVWLQLGGNFDMLNVGEQSYAPPFSSLFAGHLPTPAETQKAPDLGLDREGNISYQPADSDWVLKAGIRYGRTSKNVSLHKSLPTPTRGGLYFFGLYFPCSYFGSQEALCSKAVAHEFVDAHSKESEQHMMLDFTLGKDVGVGMFGASSTIGTGIRVVQFSSLATSDFNGDPFVNFIPQKYETYHDVYEAKRQEQRSFDGIGPELTWDASATVLGNPDNGQITFDWGVNAAVLFGRQRASIHHQSSHCHANFDGELANCSAYTIPVVKTQTFNRSRTVTVPNLGGYAGLSARYNNAKISFGYRADEFFGAMDGGQAAAKRENRGFYGPYLNLSLGFGG